VCHDAAIINLRVSVWADFPIFVIIDNPFITLLHIVLATIVRASIHKWELIAVVIGGTLLGKLERIPLGVVVGERMWVLVSATCFTHEVEIGASLRGKIDFVPRVGLVSALE